MSTLIGLIQLVANLGPLFISFFAFFCFLDLIRAKKGVNLTSPPKKSKITRRPQVIGNASSSNNILSEPRLLIACIILLLLIPLDLVYTLYSYVPEGRYKVQVPYTAKTSSSVVYATGLATITLDLPDENYDYHNRYTCETEVVLDCFRNEVFYTDDALFHYPKSTYKFHTYNSKGQYYDISLDIGHLMVHRLGIPLKEILANSLRTIIWHTFIFMLDIFGVVVFSLVILNESKQLREQAVVDDAITYR